MCIRDSLMDAGRPSELPQRSHAGLLGTAGRAIFRTQINQVGIAATGQNIVLQLQIKGISALTVSLLNITVSIECKKIQSYGINGDVFRYGKGQRDAPHIPVADIYIGTQKGVNVVGTRLLV